MYAASEKGEKYYTEVGYERGVRYLMGSEDTGIDEELLRHAHEQIKIPQKGDIESLNVSAAAAVVLYEAVRQRG